MKILFVEDTEKMIVAYKPMLEGIGEVLHFKGSNAARKALKDNKFDLVVCDHQILKFEHGDYYAEGTQIYQYLRKRLKSQIPFIHFSVTPCPYKYDLEKKDDNFYCLDKSKGFNITEFIRSIM